MCNLKHPVSGPDPAATYTGAGPTSQNPDANLGSSLDSSAPPPTTTTMQPTKLAKMLKVVIPLVQGGVAGMSADPRTLGGGKAASDFFDKQTELALRKQALGNQTTNIQSEAQLRREQMNLDRARSNVAGGTFTYTPEGGDRTRARISPESGQVENIGPDPLADQMQPVNSGGDLMMFDKRKGTVEQPTDMNPEDHGALPLPGEATTKALPYGPPSKSPAPTVLHQGDIAVDRNGNKVASGDKKTYAPRASKTGKPDPTRIENAASRILSQFGGDTQKSLDAVDGLPATGDEKVAIRARIREMKRPAAGNKRKFSFNTGQQQQLQAPGQ